MSLHLHSEEFKPEWIDAYGHMNEAYYLVVFSNSTWKLQDYFKIGPKYTEETGNALYTVEAHLRYLKEVRAPAKLNVRSTIFGLDKKRMHIGHVLAVDGQERVTFECVVIHINMGSGRSCAFPEDRFAALSAASIDQPPAWSGSRVSLHR